MAAKKATKKSTTRRPDDGQVTFLSPDLLDFDFENPRLSQSTLTGSEDESEIIRFLWKEMNVVELALSIAAWGYFEHEPLFAIKNHSRYTVIEGNRRLAAVKILRSPKLRTELRTDLPKLTAAISANLVELPVVVTTRKKVWQHIGFKHVNGPKPWGAVAKAEYIARCVNEFKVPLDDIPKLIGDTHSTVLRLYRGLMVLQQAKNEGLYDIDDRTTKRLFFSHLYTGLGYPGFQEFLGLKEANYSPKPVKARYKKKLGQLCVWLFGSTEQGKQPLIKSQNPDLRRLDEALQTERGRDALTAGLPLDLAYDASIGDDRRFREALIQAKVHMEQAFGKVHTGFDIKSDQLQTAKSILSLADSLVDAMAALQAKAKKGRK